ncbi:hypothetical protein KM043_009644 [Ampulex compressa]|nr:hypothetical protein KM043_009644 [Ampulex compressa]
MLGKRVVFARDELQMRRSEERSGLELSLTDGHWAPRGVAQCAAEKQIDSYRSANAINSQARSQQPPLIGFHVCHFTPPGSYNANSSVRATG